jgi:hypothetical protein
MKKAARNLLILALCVTASSCTKESVPEAQVARAQIDLSTPDKALKSYWAVRDENRQRREVTYSKIRGDLATEEKRLADVASSELWRRQVPSATETFTRDILDLKVESESRAVVAVNVRNSTPVPAGAELTKYDEERRRDGELYRYVLEKGQRGWQVAEIWKWETYPSPARFAKFLPRDSKPSVPSLTYDGI